MIFGAVQVEPIMPDRLKVRDQTRRDTGVYSVRGRSWFIFGTRLLVRLDCSISCTIKPSDSDVTRDGVTPEVDPTSSKKAK